MYNVYTKKYICTIRFLVLPSLLLFFHLYIKGCTISCCNTMLISATFSEMLLVEVKFGGSVLIELVAQFVKFFSQDRCPTVENSYSCIGMLGT